MTSLPRVDEHPAMESKMTKAIQTEAAALAASKGYAASQITRINLTDAGALASIELGADADGFGIFVLNFSI